MPTHRVHNFSAGPSALPLSALELARDELLDFDGTGMSIMEQSHRGKDYERVHNEVLETFGKLLCCEKTHQVLLLQGGASQQFAQVPMNLLPAGRFAEYVITGGWSEKAYEEARNVGDARVALTTVVEEGGKKVYRRVPNASELTLADDAAYVHVTSNNTLFGTQWANLPKTKAPLVVDMSSDILSRPIDCADVGLIYAGAQKNVGPSGLTIVVIRNDLVESGRSDIPKIFRYRTHAKERSLYHTPPTFAIYLARNVLRWIVAEGGLAAMDARNESKANLLYGVLDEMSGFYRAPVERASRSRMNVVWNLESEALEERFVSEAKKEGLIGLKGHRSTGGIRASLYNAVSPADVEALVSFMRAFAKKAG